jgi:TLD
VLIFFSLIISSYSHIHIITIYFYFSFFYFSFIVFPLLLLFLLYHFFLLLLSTSFSFLFLITFFYGQVLPDTHQCDDWRLLYRLSRDGASLNTLLLNSTNHQSYLLVIKDLNGAVFGGFITEQLKVIFNYYCLN